MSDEERDANDPANDVHITTAQPAGPPASDWKMPEPVFRQTSGHLPQGFEKQFPVSAAAPEMASPDAPVAAVAVEPQPYVSEEFAHIAPPVPPSNVGKRTTFGVVLIILALLVAAALIAAFLVLIYFLFLAAPANTNF